VILVVDASTLINLANGGVLGTILSLPNIEFYVSTVVRQESKTIAQEIDQAVAAHQLALVDDSLISLAAFTEAKNRYDLDDGETECLIAAQTMGASVACDDFAGRNAVRNELGVARLKGSIGLLRLAVAEGLMTSAEAFSVFTLMRKWGGYLPSLQAADF
jgi:predicted nucleic acid-binding protein